MDGGVGEDKKEGRKRLTEQLVIRVGHTGGGNRVGKVLTMSGVAPQEQSRPVIPLGFCDALNSIIRPDGENPFDAGHGGVVISY